MANSNSTHPAAMDYSDDDYEFDVIRNETSIHATSLSHVNKTFDNVELIVVCFGLLANLIGSITLFRSGHMSTPSFVYHKALGLANLAYCLNFILVKALRQYASEQRFQYASSFPSYITAFYMGVISRAVASTCGYFAMYMSLLIIADRFLALILFAKYHKFNRMVMAVRLVLASFILSSLIHSWAPWVENEIKKMQIDIPIDFHESEFRLITVYAIVPAQAHPYLRLAISIKNIYNLVIRLAYAVAQTALTICVIRAFHIQNRKRRALRISPARGRGASTGLNGNGAIGWERSLCYLMLTVAFLSCAQVLPREFKRVFDFIYPIDSILPLIHDRSLPIDTRRRYMLLAVYGHGYWKLVVNVLTAIERSILFYLYFILNRHFRAEVLAPFFKLKECVRRERGLMENRPGINFTLGPPRGSRNGKNSTQTLLSKSSTHTIRTETSGVSTGAASRLNRRLSSCVVLLSVDDGTGSNWTRPGCAAV